ncbi:2'-5' RNA ligase family protein [Paenibacillus arenilitoris]|uniref:Putative phosphoesterase IDH41_16010 n=1 Tax=Paenibacillus arenilitoris TaxID=2772299 RepID=A0A927H624_9BACL|nr:2'-5' RNA ligase family protein [Paenibacillus arenilitoris]MBD2870091.1 2'-5' RNA ligase family protein [Paenibacillus arenilitoris]
MFYGIAVFPEKHVQDLANSWRRRYDPHYAAIPAHMTVRDQEDWTEQQLQTAVDYLEQATAALSPFTVRFNRVSSFFPVSHVLYLALEDTAAMQELRNAVCSGPLTVKAPKHVYTPHLTIGQKMSADELHDMYGNLRMQSIDAVSRIDRIHLLYQTDNGSWTAYQSFLLRG